MRKQATSWSYKHCQKAQRTGAFGKRVSRRGREKRDSEEVCHQNFVTFWGGRLWNEESVVPLFPCNWAWPPKEWWAGSPCPRHDETMVPLLLIMYFGQTHRAASLGNAFGRHRGDSSSFLEGWGKVTTLMPNFYTGGSAQNTWLVIGHSSQRS